MRQPGPVRRLADLILAVLDQARPSAADARKNKEISAQEASDGHVYDSHCVTLPPSGWLPCRTQRLKGFTNQRLDPRRRSLTERSGCCASRDPLVDHPGAVKVLDGIAAPTFVLGIEEPSIRRHRAQRFPIEFHVFFTNAGGSETGLPCSALIRGFGLMSIPVGALDGSNIRISDRDKFPVDVTSTSIDLACPPSTRINVYVDHKVTGNHCFLKYYLRRASQVIRLKRSVCQPRLIQHNAADSSNSMPSNIRFSITACDINVSKRNVASVKSIVPHLECDKLIPFWAAIPCQLRLSISAPVRLISPSPQFGHLFA